MGVQGAKYGKLGPKQGREEVQGGSEGSRCGPGASCVIVMLTTMNNDAIGFSVKKGGSKVVWVMVAIP